MSDYQEFSEEDRKRYFNLARLINDDLGVIFQNPMKVTDLDIEHELVRAFQIQERVYKYALILSDLRLRSIIIGGSVDEFMKVRIVEDDEKS